MGDGCRPFFHATPLGSGDSVPLAAELAEHGIFASLPKPDTRLISTTPPKVVFPFKADPSTDPWSDWPPAWWPPKPPPGWPPNNNTLTVPDEYWDFTRRLMALCWRVAFHRAAYGYSPNAPWFNFGDSALCQPWILQMASQYIVLNWNTHAHIGATENVLVSEEWTETPPFESWKILVPSDKSGLISLHKLADAEPDYTIEVDVFDDGGVDTDSVNNRNIKMNTWQAGIVIDRAANTVTARVGDEAFGDGGPVVAPRVTGWVTLRLDVGKTFSSVYYNGVMVATGAHTVFGTRESWLRRNGTVGALMPFKNASLDGGIDYYTNRTDSLPGSSNDDALPYPRPIFHPAVWGAATTGSSPVEPFPPFDFYDITANTFKMAMAWLDQLEAIVSKHGYGV